MSAMPASGVCSTPWTINVAILPACFAAITHCTSPINRSVRTRVEDVRHFDAAAFSTAVRSFGCGQADRAACD